MARLKRAPAEALGVFIYQRILCSLVFLSLPLAGTGARRVQVSHRSCPDRAAPLASLTDPAGEAEQPPPDFELGGLQASFLSRITLLHHHQ